MPSPGILPAQGMLLPATRIYHKHHTVFQTINIQQDLMTANQYLNDIWTVYGRFLHEG